MVPRSKIIKKKLMKNQINNLNELKNARTLLRGYTNRGLILIVVTHCSWWSSAKEIWFFSLLLYLLFSCWFVWELLRILNEKKNRLMRKRCVRIFICKRGWRRYFYSFFKKENYREVSGGRWRGKSESPDRLKLGQFGNFSQITCSKRVDKMDVA